ncbi:probable ATP-dependent RNA helicase DHX37 [Liolophura sinensis]|uniref:probable ATP-dependent RNA helicase DHX37 n=1 Tax=Liolophura sinensis TaxID=3198878 RepID=UPI0031594884
MGKRKKGFNWKARENPETVIDRSGEKKIKLDKSLQQGAYDESNMLVLPAEKRKTKVKHESLEKPQKLSKKQRKRLEKVLEQREKKSKRAELLESLSQVQASSEEYSLFTSTSEMQSKAYKRNLKIETTAEGLVKVNAIAGSNKTKKNRKNPKIEEKESGEDSESSINTSDMSTDEEEEDTESSPAKRPLPQEVERDNIHTPEKSSHESSAKGEPVSGKEDQKPKTLLSKNPRESKPVINIPVHRSAEIQESRLKLPILGEEQQIMETISENPVVIICGETGSGKTTQVPQFLYEAGYAHGGGIIGVTEPRRVAAVSMSHRIATEMNLSAREVSYQIRYEGNVTDDTRIKLMTDGVLLKEVQKDFLLTKYSVIIIDEAHERSVYTDILIGLLSRIVPLRHKKGKPLKLIIMSATLRVEDFTENKRLFKLTPPVIQVDSRQFPVTIHFNKRTPEDDYLAETYRKVCKIHRMLPDGGILVFVTGQQEVHTLCKKLRNAFPWQQKSTLSSSVSKGKRTRKKVSALLDEKAKLPKISLDNYSAEPIDEEAQLELTNQDSEAELSDTEERGEEDEEGSSPLYVLPLYSLLSTEKQQKVFKPPPEGCRLCVIATNVAETSLTIPNIKYVVDTGKVKTKFYDKVTGVSTFRVTWTSKASANQRAGRAGRVGPGHCYRLYSSAVFNDDFEKFSPAEITRRPVEDLLLQMKDMDIDRVINFPFPTPPDGDQIKAAEQLLISLGALEQPVKPKRFKDLQKDFSTKITPLGRVMASFPVSPRYAKMLALGHQHDLLPYVVAIVAALSVQEMFQEIEKPAAMENAKEEQRQRRVRMYQIRRTWAGTGHSFLLGDLMVMLKAVGACEYEGCSPDFCAHHGVRYKAMKEIRKLRAQLTNTVNLVIPDTSLCLDPKLSPPNDLQAKLLRQIVLAGMADHVARRCADPPPGADEEAKKCRHAYQCTELEEPVFIHPTSVLYKQNAEFVVYQYIHETSKLYMKGVTAIEDHWLPIFAPSHCTYSKPMDEPLPRYDPVKDQVVCHMTSTYGRCCWAVSATELEYPQGLDRFKWFARALLEGEVIHELKQFVPCLLSVPATMIKPWAKLQPRTETLLKALISEAVDTRQVLTTVWRNKPKYLLSAYLEWLPESQHEMVRKIWPPLS